MKKSCPARFWLWLLLLLPGLSPSLAADTTTNTLVAPGARLQQLASGFIFTEGPVDDGAGNVYFTDIPQRKIYCWTAQAGTRVFAEYSNEANGLALAGQRQLLACEHASRAVAEYDRVTGQRRQLIASVDGKRFNSPNDLWLDAHGGIYFTDPRYGDRSNLEQDGEHVYYLAPDRKSVRRVAADLVRPNGLVGTPDGRTLYIADHGAGKIWRYRIQPDASLADKQLFATESCDGLTLDQQGNVYLTNQAVVIYTPQGGLLEKIAVPEPPSNVCFGGPDNKTLFITACTSLYSIRLRVVGAE